MSDNGFKNGRKPLFKKIKTSTGATRKVLAGSTPEMVSPVGVSSPSSPVAVLTPASKVADTMQAVYAEYKSKYGIPRNKYSDAEVVFHRDGEHNVDNAYRSDCRICGGQGLAELINSTEVKMSHEDDWSDQPIVFSRPFNLAEHRDYIASEVEKFNQLIASQKPQRVPTFDELDGYLKRSHAPMLHKAMSSVKDPDAYKMVYLYAFGNQKDFELGLLRNAPSREAAARKAPIFSANYSG
jgi:hypothetical protein